MPNSDIAAALADIALSQFMLNSALTREPLRETTHTTPGTTREELGRIGIPGFGIQAPSRRGKTISGGAWTNDLGGQEGGDRLEGRDARPTRQEVVSYIRERAGEIGIDPDVAERIARSEGVPGQGQWDRHLNDNMQSTVVNNGTREPSYGPFQLYTGGGLGNRFEAETGLDLTDTRTWPEQVDFALNAAAQGGWGPWYGRRAAGVGVREGIPETPNLVRVGGAMEVIAPPRANPARALAGETVAEPSQIARRGTLVRPGSPEAAAIIQEAVNVSEANRDPRSLYATEEGYQRQQELARLDQERQQQLAQADPSELQDPRFDAAMKAKGHLTRNQVKTLIRLAEPRTPEQAAQLTREFASSNRDFTSADQALADIETKFSRAMELSGPDVPLSQALNNPKFLDEQIEAAGYSPNFFTRPSAQKKAQERLAALEGYGISPDLQMGEINRRIIGPSPRPKPSQVAATPPERGFSYQAPDYASMPLNPSSPLQSNPNPAREPREYAPASDPTLGGYSPSQGQITSAMRAGLTPPPGSASTWRGSPQDRYSFRDYGGPAGGVEGSWRPETKGVSAALAAPSGRADISSYLPPKQSYTTRKVENPAYADFMADKEWERQTYQGPPIPGLATVAPRAKPAAPPQFIEKRVPTFTQPAPVRAAGSRAKAEAPDRRNVSSVTPRFAGGFGGGVSARRSVQDDSRTKSHLPSNTRQSNSGGGWSSGGSSSSGGGFRGPSNRRKRR